MWGRRGGAIMSCMILLVTDFGLPYTGQMRAVLQREAPDCPVIDLFCDLPAWDVQAAAYLLAAYAAEFPEGSVFLAVVDPGVGSRRAALVLEADGRWYVGPDNGLFAVIAQRADSVRTWAVTWRPATLSNSFHGRDLFSPVAARLARGERPGHAWTEPHFGAQLKGADWPQDLARIVYIDGFGNCMTGLRAESLAADAEIRIKGRSLPKASTFSDLPPDSAFWYENANKLVEIAVNQGRADRILGLKVGDELETS